VVRGYRQERPFCFYCGAQRKNYFQEALPQKAILNRLEANKVLGTEPLAVASGIKTQAEI
jgi:hypothetical protein